MKVYVSPDVADDLPSGFGPVTPLPPPTQRTGAQTHDEGLRPTAWEEVVGRSRYHLMPNVLHYET